MTTCNDSTVITIITPSTLNTCRHLAVKTRKHYIKAHVVESTLDEERLSELMSQEVFVLD